ncbi:MAG TPA: ECF-type sigma factor [Longimicrobiales bacterium]|nr:ECF-type sigma factor [Longimicrobiales bacterium]
MSEGADTLGPGEATRLIRSVREGDQMAFDRLMGVLYDELKVVADRQLRRERADHTLHATALVHEAYLKLVDNTRLPAQDRSHFLALAARAMRQILVDHARRRNAGKRGGDWERTTLTAGNAAFEFDPSELLALDAAMEQLDERQRQVVEYRFFGGMEETEIAEVLGVSERTVRRDWVKARAWLYRTLYPEEAAKEAPDGSGGDRPGGGGSPPR